MRLRVLLHCAALLTCIDTASSAVPGDAGADPVVVSVGSSEVRASELRFLLARLHEFERQSFGSTPAAVKAAFVERRLVPELVFAEEGKRRGLPGRAETAAKIQRALAQALKESLERDFDGKLTHAELESACKSAGTESADGCKDLTGYRVLLRRQRAAAEMDRLRRELGEREVAHVEYALLERLPVGDAGGSATPASSQGQP